MPSPPPPESSPPGHKVDTVIDVVHAAEELVERTVIAAERSLARRIGDHGLQLVLSALRVAAVLAVVAYFLFGAAVLATRYYFLPHIDDWRARIEAGASSALRATVSVSRIDADWQGLNPRLQLSDVVLRDAQGSAALTLPQVNVVLAWTTLIALQPRMRSLTVLAPEVEVRRLRDHRYAIAGFVIDPQAAPSEGGFLDWLLAQHLISVHDARVHFIDESGAPVAASAAPADAPSDSPGSAAVPAESPAAPGALEFTDVNFLLTRGLTGHHFALQLRPPAALAGLVDVRGEFHRPWTEPAARMVSWSGRIFAQLEYADLARLDALTHLVPAPARVEQARGAVRAWMDFSELKISRLSADVALTDVTAQLAPDLQPLRLDSLQGRITQSQREDSQSQMREVALTGLALEGPEHLHLPPTDLLYRTTRALGSAGAAGAGGPVQSHLEASRIVLGDWSRLAAQVPLPANWLALIQHSAAHGTLQDLQASWETGASPAQGSGSYALRARFSGLGFSLGGQAPGEAREAPAPVAAPSAPPAPPSAAAGATNNTSDGAASTGVVSANVANEFENLAGYVELDQNSGSLHIDSTKTRLRIPALYDERDVLFDTLAARLRWSHDAQGRLGVDVDSLALGNEDLDLSMSGSYRGAGAAPAHIDLNGRLGRARVAAVPNYLPRLLAPHALSWLRGALLDGSVTDGSFFLRGDPHRFPYADPKDGEFHAALHVQDGKIDIAPRPADNADPAAHPPRWPLLTGIDAEVVFERDHLTVSARRAKAYGYDLTNIMVRLPQLGQPDQHALIEGQGSGPLMDLLHYVATSPVNGYTGGFLAAAEAKGLSRLHLRLDIPLGHGIDTVVAGTVNLRGNDLVLRPDIAPFSNLTGQLDFTQRGIKLSGVTGGYLGGDLRLAGDTQADGTIVLQGSGTATPQGAKRQIDVAVLRRMLDRTRGLVHYSATLAVRHGTVALQADSDLLGLAADLPEPFRKTAGEARALHIETVPVAGAVPARDTVRVTLGSLASVELHRVAVSNAPMHVERGLIDIGTPASVPDAGLLLYIDQPLLDVDRWQKLLQPTTPAIPVAEGTDSASAPGGGVEGVDLLALHATHLLVAGKTMSNVAVSAKRDADQSWFADIDSDQATGSLHWVSARGPTPGRLTARLARLAIPEQEQKQVSELLDTPPTDFPALDLIADQFELGTHKLGRLEVEAQNQVVGYGRARTDTWNLQKLALTNPDGKLSASGVWQRDSGTPTRKMAVKIALNYSNAGALLARFGLNGMIKNGSGKLDGELSWRGAPFAIDYPSLDGTLHVVTEKGQFLKADAGAGRLLGVLSLQSFFHRVTGDFRDVFSEGFAFDALTASATIASGTLTTDDLIMKGVNAVVRIKGSADLHAETQNLEVVVIPEINAGTASLIYALVNPALGLGSFLANFVLRKPLSAAFTKVYSVTGPWNDPQVKRINGETGTPKAQAPTPGG